MDYETDNLFPKNKTGRDSEVRNSIRNGKVTEVLVDHTQVAVRVQYLDRGGLISKPLPVKQHGSKGAQSYWCPKVGDDVSVTMLPNSAEDGFVDGSFYTTTNPPPIIDPNTRHITFADGTFIEYAETGSTLKIDAKGPIKVKTAGIVDIQCQGAMTLESSDSIKLTAPTITLKATGNIILDAPNTKITGILWVDNIKPYAAGETIATPHVKNSDGSGGGS